MVAVIHWLWFIFSSSISAGTGISNPNGKLKRFGSISSAEEDSGFKAGPAVEPWKGGNGGSVNFLVDNGA